MHVEENNEMQNLVFDPKVMMTMVEEDSFLSFVFRDLLKRNSSSGENFVLEVLFNTHVVDGELAYDYLLEFNKEYSKD